LQNKLNFNGDKLKALEKLTMEVVKASWPGRKRFYEMSIIDDDERQWQIR
jgi:hypothetical protein